MKTRVWEVRMYLDDEPGYDDEGQPERYLTKRDLLKELQTVGPQCYGLRVRGIEITHIGHIEDRPASRRSRAAQSPLNFIPRKTRSDKGVKRGSRKSSGTPKEEK